MATLSIGPCKRCGEKERLSVSEDFLDDKKWIECLACGKSGPIKASRLEATKAWNDQP